MAPDSTDSWDPKVLAPTSGHSQHAAICVPDDRCGSAAPASVAFSGSAVMEILRRHKARPQNPSQHVCWPFAEMKICSCPLLVLVGFKGNRFHYWKAICFLFAEMNICYVPLFGFERESMSPLEICPFVSPSRGLKQIKVCQQQVCFFGVSSFHGGTRHQVLLGVCPFLKSPAFTLSFRTMGHVPM